MKIFNSFLISILSFSIINGCSTPTSTNSNLGSLLNENEKIVFASNNQLFELSKNNLTPQKAVVPTEYNTFTSQLSPDNKKVIYSVDENNVNNIYIMNSDGSNKIKIENYPLGILFPRWSSDSSKIVFMTVGVPNNLYTVNADGTNLTRLTNDKFNYVNPTFSPDGSKIAFSSDKDSQTDNQLPGDKYLYVMNSDGTNIKRLVNDKKMTGISTDWLSNDEILYNNSINLFSVKSDGSKTTQLTQNNSNATYYELPTVSKDKKKIVFTSNRDGNEEVYLRDITSGNEIRLTNNNINDEFPRWFNN